MKYILFLLCLLPFGVLAQPGYNNKTALQTDSFQLIKLPKLKGEPFFLVEDSALTQKGFVINTPKQYYQLFAQYPVDSLPVIDFTQYQLQPVSRCIYRLPPLKPDDKTDECMHRQACFYGISWFLIKRKIDG